MMDEISARAKDQAAQLFKGGFNCSEAIVRVGSELLGKQLDEHSLRMATGFGGGIGHAGCVCGALAASVMVLGLTKGRVEPTENLPAAYALTGEFHRRFQERFGGTCCRALNPHEFGSREHLKNCVRITGDTMGLLAEYLQEQGILPPNRD